MSPEFLITAFIVVLAPGTGVIYTLGTGLSRGSLAAFSAAIGCTIGILPHLLAATLGLAALLHTSAMLFQIVKFAGVLFLLYLAWQTLRDDTALKLEQAPKKRGLFKTALRGALLNILNPKLSIFFLAFLPQFLSGTPASATFEMVTLGAVFMAMTLIVFCIYGLFAASMRDQLSRRPKILTWLRRGFSAAFAGLAAKLAIEKL